MVEPPVAATTAMAFSKASRVQDVPRPDALVQEPHDGLASLAGAVLSAGVDGGDGGVAGQGHAKGLDGGGHGVGGEHPRAGARPGTGTALQLFQLLVGHRPPGVGAHRLEHVLNIDVAALEPAGHDAPAIHEDGGDVQTGGGHQGPGQVLVAAGYGDQAVEALPEGHHLDGVGDDLPADQGGLHALGAHGDAVAHRYGAELEGRPPRRPGALANGLGQPAEVDVAWVMSLARLAIPTKGFFMSSGVSPMA